MIVIVNSVTQEVQVVDHTEEDFRDFYNEDWVFGRQLDEGEDPSWLVWHPETSQVVCDLTQLSRLLHDRIDAESGAVRMRFISDSPGQQLTYQRKEAEARAYLAQPTDNLTAYPFLAAEMVATGKDAENCAVAIVAAATAWLVVGSRIEGARIAAKRAVSECTTCADMHVAAAVDWETVLSGGTA